MATAARTYCTPEEYLAFERRSEFRHEYIDGRIVAMTGGTASHNYIEGNLYSELRARLRGSTCRAYLSGMRVKIRLGTRYVYPDVVASCPPEFEDDIHDTLVNPVFIAEVLSPSTSSYDRGPKAEHYQKIPSLQEYLIVAQDRPFVQKYLRDGGFWVMSEASGLEASILLCSLGCSVALRDLYVDVDFGGSDSGASAPRSDS